MSRALSRSVRLCGALALVAAFATRARAQEMGLDLSDNGPDLRPTIAILGIAVPEGAAAADKAHADKLTTALVAASRKTGWFSKVMDAAECDGSLGAKAGAARACAVADCFADPARMLATDRVLSAQMEFGADGPTLHLQGYDVGTGVVEDMDVAAQGKPQGFDRKVAGVLKPLLQKLSTHLGLVKIVPSVADAAVEVAGRGLGTGTVEKPMPAGTLKVRVSANEYQTFEGTVTVVSKGKVELAATLTPKVALKMEVEPTLPPVVRATGPSKPFYARPGLYLAIVGAAAAGTGAYFGVTAKNIEKRSQTVSADGVSDITRKDARTARNYARLGTILMACGAAVFTGGVLWFALEPAPFSPGGAPSPGREPGSPSKEPGSEPVGFLFTAGGAF